MILLDTHVLIWVVEETATVGKRAHTQIDLAFRSGEACVSAISFWEVALLVARGRMELQTAVAEWRKYVLGIGFVELPMTGSIAIRSIEMRDLHGDRADRIILATAELSSARLFTADRRLLKWKGKARRVDATR